MMKENVYKESVLIPNEDCCLEMQRNGCCGSDFDSEGSINMTEFVFCMLATCGWTTLPLCKTTSSIQVSNILLMFKIYHVKQEKLRLVPEIN